MLDSILASHCAPALAGIKPSNIVSCFKSENPNIGEDVKALNDKLNEQDIFIDVLCECPKRFLLIVYRKKKLTEHLNKKDVKEFLASYGYDVNYSLQDYLKQLSKRIKCNEDFPHEIGAFLGYPLDDINGFIESKGRECLYIGEWKVYSDVENAKKTFCRYKNCKRALLERVEKGQKLEQIFHAA